MKFTMKFINSREASFYFARSEFLIDTWYIPPEKNVPVCVRLILVLEKYCLGFSVGYQRAPGTSEKQNRTPGTSERFVDNCGVGPSTRGQGDSASLVQRR